MTQSRMKVSYCLFPNLSRAWYVNEQKIHNTTRDAWRRANPIERDSENVILCMNRSQVQGTLDDNLKTLEQRINTHCRSTKTVHYKAICEVGNYILLNGPLVKTQQAGEIYLKSKRLQMSSEYYEIFSKHLNLVQVYIFDVAYLLPNTTGKKQVLLTRSKVQSTLEVSCIHLLKTILKNFSNSHCSTWTHNELDK